MIRDITKSVVRSAASAATWNIVRGHGRNSEQGRPNNDKYLYWILIGIAFAVGYLLGGR